MCTYGSKSKKFAPAKLCILSRTRLGRICFRECYFFAHALGEFFFHMSFWISFPNLFWFILIRESLHPPNGRAGILACILRCSTCTIVSPATTVPSAAVSLECRLCLSEYVVQNSQLHLYTSFKYCYPPQETFFRCWGVNNESQDPGFYTSNTVIQIDFFF